MSRRQAVLVALLGIGCATGSAAVVIRSAKDDRAATSSTPEGATAPVARTYEHRTKLPAEATRQVPAGFAKARGWLNVTRVPTERDLAGRVVVVDFWTSCCINCMQTLPTLAALEKKHARDPFLVVGVHTQKFDAEPEIERLRASVIRMGVTHPVAIDGDRGVWEAWDVAGWPTVVVLDAKGRVVWNQSGEPDPDELDAVIESALAEGADEGALAKDAPSFLGREIDASSPLAYPEKIAAVPGGFAIADSGHDRIVFVDDAGKVTDVVGDGTRGLADGAFGSARFAHPQGMVASGDVVYVADTENHAVRMIDRKNKRVSTIAGTGELGREPLSGTQDGKTFALRSPWDVALVGSTLYVALAGSHQIAIVDPATSKVTLFAGTSSENRKDGPRLAAAFAQPSGLATDGKDLFVLDSETSSVRKIELATGEVSTLVGKALFVWGDVDGDGATARLQHPVGLTYGGGALWVADTYNSKVKRIDAATGETKTITGGASHEALFEPAGLAWSSGKLLVADTDHGRIVSVSPGTMTASPWAIDGLKAP